MHSKIVIESKKKNILLVRKVKFFLARSVRQKNYSLRNQKINQKKLVFQIYYAPMQNKFTLVYFCDLLHEDFNNLLKFLVIQSSFFSIFSGCLVR